MPTRPDLVTRVIHLIELDEDDRRRLVELHDKIAPALTVTAERFYARLASRPETADVFDRPGPVDERVRSLVEWMSSGLLGPYDAAFHTQRARLARSHVASAVPQHYIVIAINALRCDYHDVIASLYDADARRSVIKAVDKLLDMELAVLVRHYQLDSESHQRETQTERVAALQTLSAGFAHEIRNPLNSAKLQLSVLERRLRRDSDDPRLVVPIEIVNHEIERLTLLLDEFLAFARPQSLSLGHHDVVAIARAVVADEGPLASAIGARMELIGTAAFGQVDRAKIHQVLHSLVRNSLEAIAPGGRIAVTVDETDSSLRICVEDDGPGIPDDVQQRMFEPFFSTKESGTGLGMSIVHSTVTLHGGTIAVTSSPGTTRVDITLPR